MTYILIGKGILKTTDHLDQTLPNLGIAVVTGVGTKNREIQLFRASSEVNSCEFELSIYSPDRMGRDR